MLDTVAIRVCPQAGCPKIGGERCPDHDKEMVRMVYVNRDKTRREHAAALRLQKEQSAEGMFGGLFSPRGRSA